MNKTNYHTHTRFSDGKEVAKKYIEEAIDQNLAAFGFSDHAPLPLDCDWAMKQEDTEQYLREVQELKTEVAEKIEVYCGLEVDYIPDLISIESPAIQSLNLDYTIGAVHFVDAFDDGTPWAMDGGQSVWRVGIKQIFGGKVQNAVTRYFELTREMVNNAPPTIVAHLDRIKKNNTDNRFYSEKEAWYIHQIELTLEAIAAAGSILEVNTKGMYRHGSLDPYPSKWILAKANELDIPVHLAADAHHPYYITSSFNEAAQLLIEAGYTETKVLLNGQWRTVPIPANVSPV